MDSEASFFIDPLQLSTSSFQCVELRGEPGGRTGERNRSGFDRSKTVKAGR